MSSLMEGSVTDAAFASLTDEIVAARGALLELMQDQTDRVWSAYELKTRAQNGWSSGAMTLALEGLVDDGTVEVLPDLQIRLRDSA
jgi:hypothetical protein